MDLIIQIELDPIISDFTHTFEGNNNIQIVDLIKMLFEKLIRLYYIFFLYCIFFTNRGITFLINKFIYIINIIFSFFES